MQSHKPKKPVYRFFFKQAAGLPYTPWDWNDLDLPAFNALVRDHKTAIAALAGKKKVDISAIAHFATTAPDFAAAFQKAVGRGVQMGANCYAYAADDKGNPPGYKAQPGDATGYVSKNEAQFFKDLPALVEQDGARRLTRADDLRADEYAIALLVDRYREKYHLYRQDADGAWSHKRGHLKVNRHDASGALIRNPEFARHNYGRTSYAKAEYHFYGVPRGGLTVGVPADQRAAVRAALEQPDILHGLLQTAAWGQAFRNYSL